MTKAPADLESWRERCSDILFVFAFIAVPIAMIFSFPTLIAEKQYIPIAVDLFVYAVLGFRVFITSGSYRFWVYVWLFLIYLMTVTFYIMLGPGHARSMYLVFCVVMAAIFFGVPGALLSAGLNAGMLLVLYRVMGPGDLEWAAVYSEPFAKWLMFIVNSSLISLVLGLFVALMLERMDYSYRQEKENLRRLSDESKKLKQTLAALEKEINDHRQTARALEDVEIRLLEATENIPGIVFQFILKFDSCFHKARTA